MTTHAEVRNFTLTKTDTADGSVNTTQTLGFLCELAVQAPNIPRVALSPLPSNLLPPTPSPPRIGNDNLSLNAVIPIQTLVECGSSTATIYTPCVKSCLWFSLGDFFWVKTYCNGVIAPPSDRDLFIFG
jgi:hypothetical protein